MLLPALAGNTSTVVTVITIQEAAAVTNMGILTLLKLWKAETITLYPCAIDDEESWKTSYKGDSYYVTDYHNDINDVVFKWFLVSNTGKRIYIDRINNLHYMKACSNEKGTLIRLKVIHYT